MTDLISDPPFPCFTLPLFSSASSKPPTSGIPMPRAFTRASRESDWDPRDRMQNKYTFGECQRERIPARAANCICASGGICEFWINYRGLLPPSPIADRKESLPLRAKSLLQSHSYEGSDFIKRITETNLTTHFFYRITRDAASRRERAWIKWKMEVILT